MVTLDATSMKVDSVAELDDLLRTDHAAYTLSWDQLRQIVMSAHCPPCRVEKCWMCGKDAEVTALLGDTYCQACYFGESPEAKKLEALFLHKPDDDASD